MLVRDQMEHRAILESGDFLIWVTLTFGIQRWSDGRKNISTVEVNN